MTGRSWHRTKIVCTLGPATDPPGVVARLIESGMDVARINASHGNHADHARRIQLVRRSARESGRPVAILIDLPGPKFRIGELPDGCCKLDEGTIVTLATEDDIAEEGVVPKEGNSLLPVRNPELLAVLRPGESVFLADGSIDLRVKAPASHVSHDVSRVQCEVRVGGIVRSGSGINVPES